MSGPGDFDAGVGLFDLFDLGARVDVDAALFEDAGELFGNFFVFGGHEAREKFDERDFGAEAAEDGAELDADCAGADDNEGLRHLGDGEHFNVGEDAIVGLEAEDHFGVGAGGEDDVLRFDFALCAVGAGEVDGVNSLFGGAGEAAVSGDDGDLVLLHQEAEALGVLVDDGGLAFLHGVPVEGAAVDVVDAVFGGVLEVVPELGVEKEGLGGDAADVEAGAAEDVGGFDEGDLEAELSGANGRGIACGSAADDGYVIDSVCQSCSVPARSGCRELRATVQFNAAFHLMCRRCY